jgi:O-acetyl-ADP-ribose deacetylase (regulator of RNase III)
VSGLLGDSEKEKLEQKLDSTIMAAEQKFHYETQELLRQSGNDWFHMVTGVKEFQFLQGDRKQFIEELPPVDGDARLGPHLQIKNRSSAATWDAGAFSVWSIEGLVHAQPPPPSERKAPCVFEIHVRMDDLSLPVCEVSCIQASTTTEERAMFQVASNFNCCEMGNARVPADYGEFVTNLMYDSTQGPAAASGVAVAAITRTHAAFYNTATDSKTWGVTNARQIELLGDDELRPHFPVYNGKAFYEVQDTPDWLSLPDSKRQALVAKVKVGLHSACFADFARAGNRSNCRLVLHKPQIDQVCVAAMNVTAPGARALQAAEADSKMHFLLSAAYKGTYAAAALRKCQTLYLTCVGGGVFYNPLEDVASAMAMAHAEWADKSHLQRVVLPLFPKACDPTCFVQALNTFGVDVTVIKHTFDGTTGTIVKQSFTHPGLSPSE